MRSNVLGGGKLASEKMGLNRQHAKCPYCHGEIVIELGRMKVVTLQEFQRQVKEVVASEKAAGTW